MNFSVPFSLKGSSKCTNHVNVHKLNAGEYINTVCSLDLSVSNFLKLLNKVYNELGDFIKANCLKSAKMSLRKEKAFLIILNQMR